MKSKLNTIVVVIIVLALIFGGYKAYGLFKQWEANRFSEINMLRSNQDLFLKKVTELSVTVTKVVNDTVKVQTVTKKDATYEGLKEQVLELKKDEEANKEEIEALRKELSEQRKAFLASDDTILIKTDDETLLLYRDESGALQPASEGITKIIEHRDVEDVPILAEEKIAISKTAYNLKAGGFYNITDKDYGLIISKQIFGWKPYSVNASILSDLKDLEGIKIGANINYEVKSNLELGIGITIDNTYYFVLEYAF